MTNIVKNLKEVQCFSAVYWRFVYHFASCCEIVSQCSRTLWTHLQAGHPVMELHTPGMLGWRSELVCRKHAGRFSCAACLGWVSIIEDEWSATHWFTTYLHQLHNRLHWCVVSALYGCKEWRFECHKNAVVMFVKSSQVINSQVFIVLI